MIGAAAGAGAPPFRWWTNTMSAPKIRELFDDLVELF